MFTHAFTHTQARTQTNTHTHCPGKEGAVSGGNSFVNAVGEDLLDSIVGDQIPIYTEQEKYNLAVESTVDRIAAKLQGKEVPGG